MKIIVYQHIERFRYWGICFVSILCLSVFGRKLQIFIGTKINLIWIAVCVILLLFVVLFVLYKNRVRYSITGKSFIFALSLLCAGALAVYYKVLFPVETVHFLIFFCFGWFSLSAFGPVAGFMVVIGMAVGDEILQYYLPTRVGDLHDVLINSVSGFCGYFMRKRK